MNANSTDVIRPAAEVLPPGRQAGVCLHVTSLPGPFGIGEIGDAAHAFLDTLADMGIGVWQFLPTGPTAFGDSPYQPLSTFANNEMLIDIATLIRAGVVTSIEADSLIHLPSHRVNYGELIPKKWQLLERAAGRFFAQASAEVKSDFDRFVDENDTGWLHDYALYRTIKQLHGERAWTEWEDRFARRDADALREVEAKHGQQIEYFKILQCLFERQWRRLRQHAADNGITLFGDLPIYVAIDSADAWAHGELLRLDADGRPSRVAGVPPDYFSKDGQLWGNPVYDWPQHEKSGYRWWIERLQAAARLADIVRVDHFRGFEAYWSIPANADTATTGEWLPGPGSAIFDALEHAMGPLPIVAEDLGVITPEVEALRKRFGFPGMKVLQFEVGHEAFELATIDENCVCYTGTHDNDTTLGWFQGSADDIRTPEEIAATRRRVLAITGGTPETVHTDLVRLAFESDARLAVVPLQDYLGLGSEARLNTPGEAGGNWTWRVNADRFTPTFRASVSDMVAAAGRSPVA